MTSRIWGCTSTRRGCTPARPVASAPLRNRDSVLSRTTGETARGCRFDHPAFYYRHPRSAEEATKMTPKRLFEFGGYLAATILVAFGITALVMGVNGRGTVSSSLKQEQITGTPDMTPTGIAGEIAGAKAAQAKLF